MGFWSWLLDGPEPNATDEIADLRSGAGAFIKRAIREGGRLDLKIWRCSISDIPVGSWRFIVERIPDKEPDA